VSSNTIDVSQNMFNKRVILKNFSNVYYERRSKSNEHAMVQTLDLSKNLSFATTQNAKAGDMAKSQSVLHASKSTVFEILQ